MYYIPTVSRSGYLGGAALQPIVPESLKRIPMAELLNRVWLGLPCYPVWYMCNSYWCDSFLSLQDSRSYHYRQMESHLVVLRLLLLFPLPSPPLPFSPFPV